MWTAKRIVILVVGLVVCLGGYTVYSLCLGLIDGTRSLPEWMLPSSGEIKLPPPGETPADKMLKVAFGDGCEELRRPLRLWLPDKGVVLSAGDFSIESKDGGRVRLAPFSAAIFHKKKEGSRYPEITALRCDVAILNLDRPVTQYSELASRKVIGIELQGGRPGVTLFNNRGTVEKNDDIDILVTHGSVFYEERRNLIWTEGVVCLTDHESKPPTIVRGKHLEMFLAKEVGINKSTKSSAKIHRANGQNDANYVDKLILHSDVEMRFWVDGRAGFLGGTNDRKPRPAVTGPADELNPPDKAQIIIKTGGMFVYDLAKEVAWFESPPAREKAGDEPLAPDQVHVQRHQKVEGKDKLDQLTCDRLDLQFRRKVAVGAAAANDRTGSKEIETAKAIRRGNNDVALALDSEHMAAYGTELFYRAGDLVNGPQMILKGDPLRSNKDGHFMKCKELHLFSNSRAGEGQKAWAKGPGQIDLLDAKNPAKDEFPMHVLWRDTLTVVKEKEGDQLYDLLTVVGEASFIDDQQKQELHGEKIMVWMRNTQHTGKKTVAAGPNRQELARVFAQDKVRALSPEFIVRQTNRMTMTFPPAVVGGRLPEVKNVSLAHPNRQVPTPPKLAVDNAKKPIEQKKPRHPIEIEGNEITGTVGTLATAEGPKKHLQDLVVKGNAYVFQAGDKPGEKQIDITGQLLTLKSIPESEDKVLVVHGDKKNPAKLELGDMVLLGPIVTVDQAKNRANVDGPGAMDMPSNKNLDGTASARKNTRVTVYWNKDMAFDGKNAHFSGGVQARENGSDSYLKCEELVAVLDKHVSFKGTEKSLGNQKQEAKIDRIICDKNVFIDDRKRDENKVLTQWSIVQGRELITEEDGLTRVAGPGQVKALAKGNAELGAAPQKQNDGQAANSEWKLTHVKFADRMHANTRANAKNAKFYGFNAGIEVFHFPASDINAKMDPDRPPKDGLYLRCETLEVQGKQNLGRTSHIMIAERNVYFRTDQYLGYADIVKYDEANDIIIFEAINGQRVRLFKMVGDRADPTNFSSAKVLYNRKTGKMETEGVKSITN